jgi:hypothetical protein
MFVFQAISKQTGTQDTSDTEQMFLLCKRRSALREQVSEECTIVLFYALLPFLCTAARAVVAFNDA